MFSWVMCDLQNTFADWKKFSLSTKLYKRLGPLRCSVSHWTPCVTDPCLLSLPFKIAVVFPQPVDSRTDLLCEVGCPGSASSLPHCIKHWCSCKGRLEPVSHCGLHTAYSKSLFSISFPPFYDWYLCFHCADLNEVEWSCLSAPSAAQCMEARRITRNESDNCLWPLAEQSDATSWKWLCVCIWFLYSHHCLCVVHLCCALWLLPQLYERKW